MFVGESVARAPVAVTGLADLAAVRSEPAHRRQDLVALLVGTEGAGLTAAAESAADVRVRIPIAEMALNDVLHIKDLKLPPGVKVMQDEDLIVATVKEIEEEVAAAPAEGRGQRRTRCGTPIGAFWSTHLRSRWQLVLVPNRTTTPPRIRPSTKTFSSPTAIARRSRR